MCRLLYIVLVFAVFIAAMNSCDRSMEEVDKVKEYLPDAIEFLENNEDFFNILLKVQERMAAYNARNYISTTKYNILESCYIGVNEEGIGISIYQKSPGEPLNITQNWAWFELLTIEEYDAVQSVLVDLYNMNTYVERIIMIRPENVDFRYIGIGWAIVHIENPPDEQEEVIGKTYYDYAFSVTDKWGIRVYRHNKG